MIFPLSYIQWIRSDFRCLIHINEKCLLFLNVPHSFVIYIFYDVMKVDGCRSRWTLRKVTLVSSILQVQCNFLVDVIFQIDIPYNLVRTPPPQNVPSMFVQSLISNYCLKTEKKRPMSSIFVYYRMLRLFSRSREMQIHTNKINIFFSFRYTKDWNIN